MNVYSVIKATSISRKKRGIEKVYKLENFCNTLLKLRKERGWTQTELAARIGIAPQSVSKWECAIGYPDITLFPIIAELFGVPIGVLFGDPQMQPDARFGMENEIQPQLCAHTKESKYFLQGNNIFSFPYRNGSLEERYENGEFYFLYNDGEKEHKLSLYKIDRPRREERELYCGYTKDEVLSSGHDLIGERLLEKGDPIYREVKEALPPIARNTYTILGGVASAAGLTVDSQGKVYHQLSGRNRRTSAIFSPAEYDSRLGSIMPYQVLVNKEYPLLLSVHTDGEETLEFLYFVEPGEPDRDPICWIRVKRYRNKAPREITIEYRVAAIAREAEEKELFDTPPSEALFLDALYDTVAYWVGFSEEGASFVLPEEELSRVARGSVAFAALTFTCEHAHYGHRFYGKELHDNFPPNYIFALEALACLGRGNEAKSVFSHFLKYVLRLDGRINYRQGTGLNFGASAAEYGMLLHLAGRYCRTLGIDALEEKERKKLIGMGEVILEHLRECEEFGGLKLIRMCAEADTNERIHVYINNNLWSIRGLEALAALLGEKGAKYKEAAEDLRINVDMAMERFGARDTRFGDLPPFRLGYTPTPATLSRCADTFYPLNEEQTALYYRSSWERSDIGREEDLVENTYANYRYYPEMLSAMLLSERHADSLIRMRENIGGEIIGMTRFNGRLDDWPVLNYARFLIETGRIEKYLLLLYAHAAHHGDPELMTYYEQVSIDGAAIANDCIPSLLTVPTMLAWCFAYESIEERRLRLLSALPREWYGRQLRAKGISYSGGRIDLEMDSNQLSVRFECTPSIPVEVVWRAKESISLQDISVGREDILEIKGNVLLLKSGKKEFELSIN